MAISKKNASTGAAKRIAAKPAGAVNRPKAPAQKPKSPLKGGGRYEQPLLREKVKDNEYYWIPDNQPKPKRQASTKRPSNVKKGK